MSGRVIDPLRALGCQEKQRMPGTGDEDGCKPAQVCWKGNPVLYKTSKGFSLLSHVFTPHFYRGLSGKTDFTQEVNIAKLRAREGRVCSQ